jgi:hypothetical protein
MTKKVAIVGLFLESNRYADVVPAQQFRVMRREQITADARSASPERILNFPSPAQLPQSARNAVRNPTSLHTL